MSVAVRADFDYASAVQAGLAPPGGHQVRRPGARVLRQQGRARRPDQALRLDGAGAADRPGRRHRRPGLDRQHAQGQPAGRGRAHHGHQRRAWWSTRPRSSSSKRPSAASSMPSHRPFRHEPESRSRPPVHRIGRPSRPNSRPACIGRPKRTRPSSRWWPTSWPTCNGAATRPCSSTRGASTGSMSTACRRSNSRPPSCGPPSRRCRRRRRMPSRRRRAGSASYHEAQKKASGESWSYRDADGTLARPEGHAAGPGRHLRAGRQGRLSVVSVLMNAIPAQVAGVGEIIMVVPTPGGEQQSAGAGRRPRGRRHARLHDRRRPGGGGAGLRHGHDPGGRQDHRPRQRLRGRRQAARVRHRRHRHDRRPERDPGAGRRQHAARLGGDGPVQPGRARRTGAEHPAVPRRRLHRARAAGDRPPAALDATAPGSSPPRSTAAAR